MNYVNFIYIAFGGALGAISRYILSTWIYNKSQQIFPYGTLAVNIIGCFFLGVFYTLTLEKSVIAPQIRIMVTVGFLGAFTTFSTFSLETLNLVKENNISMALLYIGTSVILGLLAVWLGTVSANFFNKLGERGENIAQD